MKWLLLTILLAFNVHSESGFYYDQNRVGEGISVAETADGGIAWVMFTFIDAQVSVPPVVSPAPPDQALAVCNNNTLWLTGHSEVLAEGFAIGTVYLSLPSDYPTVSGLVVSEPIAVGTFLIEVDGDGFDLILESNNTLPSLSIFDHTFTFINPLAR